MNIFQQHGYKINEFAGWLGRHWNTILFPVPHLALILVTLIGVHYLTNWLTLSAVTIVLIIFSACWFGAVGQYNRLRLKKPLVFTPRVKRLTAVFAAVSVLIPVFGTVVAFRDGVLFPDIFVLVFAWVFADLILPYLLILAAAVIYPLEWIIQFRFKQMARKKIESMPDLRVIAITGSYGKTSTKFLIDAVLKERFKVCTTPGSYNTPMGICKVINNDLEPADQFLVLEMGARYAGNIDELCRIARPDIAVITNVGLAHLESFRSQEAIAHTKAAVIRHLKPGGLAVLNGDDPKVRQMSDRNDIESVFAGISQENNHFFAKNITYDENGCSFDLHVKDEEGMAGRHSVTGGSGQINMSLLGEHSVQNATLAAAMGLKLGLRLPTVKVALRNVKPVEHRLELKKQNGVIIIDDAFNSNPTGARNAISVLSSFKTGRKFVVTPGMIELGARQEDENKNFGLWMAKNAPDHIYLVGREQTRPVYEGLKEGGYRQEQISVVNSLFEANEQLRKDLKKGDVVLYENDLPDSYSE